MKLNITKMRIIKKLMEAKEHDAHELINNFKSMEREQLRKLISHSVVKNVNGKIFINPIHRRELSKLVSDNYDMP